MSKKTSTSTQLFTIYDPSKPLSSIYTERAAKELKEDPDQKSAHLESFKRWIKSMPHLKCSLNDDFLLAFLRQAKYSHMKAQARLDKFCTFRTNPTEGCPEWFKDTPQRKQNWEKWLEMKIWGPLGFTPKGVFVAMMRMADADFSEVSMTQFQGSFQLWTDLCIVDPRMQIGGMCMIMDLTGLKKETMRQFLDPKNSKASTKYFQECLPFRINKLVYYNLPKIFESLFKVYSEWLSEKIKSKIMLVSGDLTPVFEAVPGSKDLIPKDLGGNCKYTFEEICEKNKSVLKAIPAVGDQFDISVDESKRPKESKYSFGVYKDLPGDIMGKSGTYVKLDDEI